MKLSERMIGAIVAFVTIAVTLVAIALLERASSETKVVEAPPSKWDDQIDELERQAIGQAFQKHIAQLYNIWVTDNYQPKIPPKALVGARNARDAYIRSMEAIENRKHVPLPATRP
jgi:hypothetical protein